MAQAQGRAVNMQFPRPGRAHLESLLGVNTHFFFPPRKKERILEYFRRDLSVFSGDQLFGFKVTTHVSFFHHPHPSQFIWEVNAEGLGLILLKQTQCTVSCSRSSPTPKAFLKQWDHSLFFHCIFDIH